MDGLDLVPLVTSAQRFDWHEGTWKLGEGYRAPGELKHHVVAIDYGVKRNILRLLTEAGCDVTVVPATASAEDILALKPDGVFLSNGPGDPAATGEYAVPVIRKVLEKKIPTFGICLGHQMLSLAVGAKTMKMHQGHHGANHPVKDKTTGKVEITSMNHGFAVDPATLPAERSRDPYRPCSTGPIAASRSPTARPSRCSTTPKPPPARRTAITCSTAS